MSKKDLEVIEKHLADMFMPEFARAVVDKQLADIGETRETYRRELLDLLLQRIEEKVLRSFKGKEAHYIVLSIKRKIASMGA